MRVEEVTQGGQPVVLGPHGAVQGVEHEAVGGLVEEELHAQPLGILQGDGLVTIVEHHHHAVAVDEAHGSVEVEVFGHQSSVPVVAHLEEAHGPSVLEVVFYLLVVGAVQFHDQLVERVVIRASGAHGIPGIAPFHLALHAHALRLLAESLPFVLVFKLQQHALLLE